MKIRNRVSLNVLLGSILAVSLSGTAVPVSAASLTWDGSDGSWTIPAFPHGSSAQSMRIGAVFVPGKAKVNFRQTSAPN